MAPVAPVAFEGLYAIVNVPHPHGLDPVEVTRAVLGDRPVGGKDGAAAVQLRAKHATTEQRVAWLEPMAAICQESSVPLFINDDVEAARRTPQLAGLHLGQDDDGADAIDALRAAQPGLQIGLSTHDLPQLREALRQRPSYVAFGPVARTATKDNPDPVVGFDALTDAGRITSKPLVAIGGLDEARACEAIRRGASLAAVIGSLVRPSLRETKDAAIALAQALQAAAAPLTVDQVAQQIPVLEPELLAELARWGDSFSVHMALELPARFAPQIVDGVAMYRPCEVQDLIRALGKRPSETWDQWKQRGHDDDSSVVQLRRLR